MPSDRAYVHVITRPDGLYYTHGYPGVWRGFPRFQVYHSKSAATRQANKLKEAFVSRVLLEVTNAE